MISRDAIIGVEFYCSKKTQTHTWSHVAGRRKLKGGQLAGKGVPLMVAP